MKNYFDLSGRVAVVTGASSGLGYAYAKALAEQGARVAVLARRLERLNALKAEIEAAGGDCFPVACDVSKEDMVVSAVAAVIAHYGKIDILVNNAGSINVCPTTELTLDAWNGVVDLSMTGYFLMARECGKNMIANKYGRIINTGSMFGLISMNKVPNLAYNTTKGAVPNFTRSLAQEWADHGITVNAIAPGMFPSEMMVVDEGTNQLLQARCPIGRAGKVEELLSQLLVFASESSGYTTGQTIAIDGGWTIV